MDNSSPALAGTSIAVAAACHVASDKGEVTVEARTALGDARHAMRASFAEARMGASGGPGRLDRGSAGDLSGGGRR